MEEVESKEPLRLALPSAETLRLIAEKQDARAAEIRERRRAEKQQLQDANGAGGAEAEALQRGKAARLIQKNYRGYRARRRIRGYDIESTARWESLAKDVRYHNTTAPVSREERTNTLSPTTTRNQQVRDRWKRVGTIAARAGSDDTESSSDVGHIEDPEEAEKLKKRKRKQREEAKKNAKVMGLEYFLEMVDHKHRYGSSLRKYHNEWKKAGTTENFFYWLDHGEGKDIDLPERPRERLDYERVRYLSPEDRKQYEVEIDKQGLFRWKKDNQPVTTSVDFKDSIEGIVPSTSTKPTWREVTTGGAPEPEPYDSDSSSISGLSTGSAEDSAKYTNTELHDAKGLAKLNHLSVDAVMNHMLRKTTKKNTWIFVVDTSFKIYIGIKQSGAFQHSSFLRGARVSAAGLIKVKRGQLRKMSPLSGHYAPPLKNFRQLLKNLQACGTDLSHLSTSRSYAVLLGLEGYLGAKRQVHAAEQGVKDVLDPETKKKREQEAMDKSQSAQREREVLAQEAKQRRKSSLSHRFMKRLGYRNDPGPELIQKSSTR